MWWNVSTTACSRGVWRNTVSRSNGGRSMSKPVRRSASRWRARAASRPAGASPLWSTNVNGTRTWRCTTWRGADSSCQWNDVRNTPVAATTLLPRRFEGGEVHRAVHGEGHLLHVDAGPWGEEGVEEQALLQRGQLVDVLHVGRHGA